MHTIGASGDCDISPVVYYAQNARVFAYPYKFNSNSK